MARLFDDAQNESLYLTSAVLSAHPLTIAFWGYFDAVSRVHNAVCIADSSDLSYFAVGIQNTDAVYAALDGPVGGQQIAYSTADISINTWHHICGVFTDSNNRAAFIDGGNKGTDTGESGEPTGLDNTTIGVFNAGILYGHVSGRIAEVAFWNIALSDSEVAQVALGVCPLMVRPDALVAYYPLGGIYGVNSGNAADGDIDIVGGYHMDPQNTPSVADHPTQLWYPNSGIVVPGLVGAAGVTVPLMAYHYRRQRAG